MYGTPIVELNNVSYCEAHERDVCHDCIFDWTIMPTPFRLPHSSSSSSTASPDYPTHLANITDGRLRSLLAQRWLEMQQVLYPGERIPLCVRLINLPVAESPAEARMSALDLQAALLQRFQQLHVIAQEQRYFFASQAKIMLEDYDTFVQASVLYQKELEDLLERAFSLLALRGEAPGKEQNAYGQFQKSKASVLNTLGYFLGLQTHRTLWRAMEMTAEAWMAYVGKFNESVDGLVMEEKGKASLLQLLGHVFWSLQHAQYLLQQLRANQHVAFQRGAFPFYPYLREAMEAGFDVHLLIAKLSNTPLHDFPKLSLLLSAFRQAGSFDEQMESVNVEIMAAIDEMSTRFRVMEVLIHAASLVATEAETKAAILAFPFDPEGEEVTSKEDDMSKLFCNFQNSRAPSPNKASASAFLQKLLVRENLIRRKHADAFMTAPFLSAEATSFTIQMFEAFKIKYSSLYHKTIRQQMKEFEHSLLPQEIARRFQHRKEMAMKKKKKPLLTIQEKSKADIAEARSVSQTTPLNPNLFWEIGDGSSEKYEPPVVREKMKTRKPTGGSTEPTGGTEATTSTASSSDADVAEKEEPSVDHTTEAARGSPVCRQVKDGDLTTRDVLWRKVKGTLKWSKLVQFLTHLGCRILNLDGSKKKVVDTLTGRCAVLHRPHPGDDCRPDQRDSYRIHIEDWLRISYSDVVPSVPVTNELQGTTKETAGPHH